MHECLGKHLRISFPFPIAILNGTFLFREKLTIINSLMNYRFSGLHDVYNYWWLSIIVCQLLSRFRGKFMQNQYYLYDYWAMQLYCWTQYSYDETMDEQLRQPYQGQLIKFTNVVKGWQSRWFVLNPELGSLHYYLVSLLTMFLFASVRFYSKSLGFHNFFKLFSDDR